MRKRKNDGITVIEMRKRAEEGKKRRADALRKHHSEGVRFQKGGPSPNPAGRPPAGWSFAELIRAFGEKQIPPRYAKDCAELCKDFGDTWKHGLVAMMYKLALAGDFRFAEELFSRVDGRAPIVNINNNTEVKPVVVLPAIVDAQVEEVEEIGPMRNILQLPPVNGNGNGNFNGNGHNGHSDLP